MQTISLSELALDVIKAYTHLTIGSGDTSVPYFNNKTKRTRMALRVHIGKGSPADIREELETVLLKNHIARDTVSGEVMKKLLVENNLGIDCSAYAYYILDAESRYRGLGHINRRLTFVRSQSPLGKMRSYLRPAENCDVRTLAHDKNTRMVKVTDIQPGDMITMTDGPEGPERDHVLIVSSIDTENGILKKFSYTHAIAYPADGLMGTGIKFGAVTITNSAGALTDQQWTESGTSEGAAGIVARMQKSKTDIRRLKWFD
ncbi:MAG TPA: hypothetical protein VF438_00030 [Candidatus Paceibacterota bacterium]